jgi:hypothetical protein
MMINTEGGGSTTVQILLERHCSIVFLVVHSPVDYVVSTWNLVSLFHAVLANLIRVGRTRSKIQAEREAVDLLANYIGFWVIALVALNNLRTVRAPFLSLPSFQGSSLSHYVRFRAQEECEIYYTVFYITCSCNPVPLTLSFTFIPVIHPSP